MCIIAPLQLPSIEWYHKFSTSEWEWGCDCDQSYAVTLMWTRRSVFYPVTQNYSNCKQKESRTMSWWYHLSSVCFENRFQIEWRSWVLICLFSSLSRIEIANTWMHGWMYRGHLYYKICCYCLWCEAGIQKMLLLIRMLCIYLGTHLTQEMYILHLIQKNYISQQCLYPINEF